MVEPAIHSANASEGPAVSGRESSTVTSAGVKPTRVAPTTNTIEMSGTATLATIFSASIPISAVTM